VSFIEKASRLYEQKRSAVLAATALEMYVRRLLRLFVCIFAASLVAGLNHAEIDHGANGEGGKNRRDGGLRDD
jgi:hypothetical protein